MQPSSSKSSKEFLYLHTQFRQSHNDIKPENVLLDREPRDGKDAPRAMIADFGCAATYGEGKGGDPRYCPVEVLTGNEAPSVTSDVWSLGITLYEMLTGDLAFVDHYNISGWNAFVEAEEGRLFRKLNTAWEQMGSGKITYAPCSKCKDKTARSLAQAFLQVNPAKRITLEAALQHPWFQLADCVNEDRPLDSSLVASIAKRAKNFKLRAGLLQFVESKLQGEHIGYYTQLWNKVDTNHDGVMDFHEFSAMWASIEFPKHKKKPPAEDIFHVADVDMNGTISFDEFVAFTFDPRRMDKEAREQCLQSAFSGIAGDDGLIQREELEQLFSEDVKALVAILFKEIDSDGDGSINYKEFSKYILKLCEP